MSVCYVRMNASIGKRSVPVWEGTYPAGSAVARHCGLRRGRVDGGGYFCYSKSCSKYGIDLSRLLPLRLEASPIASESLSAKTWAAS